MNSGAALSSHRWHSDAGTTYSSSSFVPVPRLVAMLLSTMTVSPHGRTPRGPEA